MSSVRVEGRVLVACLKAQKKVYLEGIAKTRADLEVRIRSGLRKKWWQWGRPRTLEEALKCSGGMSFEDAWDVMSYKDSTPEGGEKSWRRHWGPLLRLAEHASATGGFVELSDEHASLLKYSF